MISSAFLRALKDPFPPARQAGVLGMAATQNFFTLNEIAQRLLPAMCSMTRDPEKGVRDQVTNISKKSVYSKTRLIRHLCNLFPCVICDWFSCLFFFINFNVFYTVYSDTLCILTQTVSPSACLFRQVSLYSVWYHIITNLDSVLSRILFILDISSPIYFFFKVQPPPPLFVHSQLCFIWKKNYWTHGIWFGQIVLHMNVYIYLTCTLLSTFYNGLSISYDVHYCCNFSAVWVTFFHL